MGRYARKARKNMGKVLFVTRNAPASVCRSRCAHTRSGVTSYEAAFSHKNKGFAP